MTIDRKCKALIEFAKWQFEHELSENIKNDIK